MEQKILIENTHERPVSQEELAQLKREAETKEIRLKEMDNGKIKKLTKLEG